MRAPPLLVAPLALFVLALTAVVALPYAGYALMSPQGAGDFASGLRAHVAWARVVGVALAVSAAVLVARGFVKAPARALRSAVVVMIGGSVLAGAAALPAYDEAVLAGMRARYVADAPASALEWDAASPGWRDDATSWRAMGRASLVNHSAPVEIALPDLAKGDAYRVMVAFRTGANETQAYYASGFQGWSSTSRCESWDGQHPAPRPDAEAGAAHVTSAYTRECTAMRGGPVTLDVAWTGFTPTHTHASVLVTPTFATVVLARLDTSLLLVGLTGALAAFTAVAHAAAEGRGSTEARRAATRVLLAGVTLVTAGWAVAAVLALWGGDAPWWLNDANRARLGSFLVMSALATAGNVAFIALLAPERNVVRTGDALKWSALMTTAVVVVAPAAAANAWLKEGPGAFIGILVSLLVLAATAATGWASRARGGATAPESTP